MRPVKWLLAGLLAAICASALAIDTGGLPSRPTFQVASLGAVNPNSQDTVTGENTRHMFQITELNTTADQPSLSLNAYGPSAGGLFANDEHWNRYNGTVASPTAILSGDFFGAIGGRGWDGTSSLSQSAVGMQFQASENWSSTNHGAVINFVLTPSAGSITRLTSLKLSSVFGGQNLTDVYTNGTGDSSLGLLRFVDQAGTRYGYAGKASTGTITYESDAALKLVANNGTDALTIDTSHNLNVTGLTGTVPWVAQTTGSYTATLSTGCTTTPTVTIHWLKVGSMVTLWSNTATAFNCTGNTTQRLTDASVPAALRPSSTRCIAFGFSIEDNTTAALGNLEVTSAGVLQFGKQLTGTGSTLCGGPNSTNAGTWAVDMFTATYDIT